MTGRIFEGTIGPIKAFRGCSPGPDPTEYWDYELSDGSTVDEFQGSYTLNLATPEGRETAFFPKYGGSTDESLEQIWATIKQAIDGFHAIRELQHMMEDMEPDYRCER